jgi:uncharacterized protein (DUF2062 family)
MLFKRRDKPGAVERLKLWIWPRVSWRRSGMYYLKRILRLSGTPYAIAMGAAIGTGISFTPFIGFHIILIAAAAWLVRGNVLAGIIASAIGNPVTFPFMWAGSYRLGKAMLGESVPAAPESLHRDLLEKSWDQLWPVMEPMTIGSLPLAFISGAVVYLLVYKAVSAYRRDRSERFAGRRQQANSPAE